MLQGVLTGAGLLFVVYLFQALAWLSTNSKWKSTGTLTKATVTKLISETPIFKDKNKKKISHKECVYNLEAVKDGITYNVTHKQKNLPVDAKSYAIGETFDIYLSADNKECYVIPEKKKEINNYLKVIGISFVVALICIMVVAAIYG